MSRFFGRADAPSGEPRRPGSSAYPGKRGGEVEVRESGGASYLLRLEDVVNATALDVRERFRAAAESVVGAARAREIESCIDGLDGSDDLGRLGTLPRATAG